MAVNAPSARCRFCGNPLQDLFVDLGMSPLCESFLSADQLDRPEVFYPLYVFVCRECFLVQLQEYVSPDQIFKDYAYFSSYSDSWLRHAEQYTETVARRLSLDGDSFVVEIASNDGYLLKNFVARSIPCLGIEPAANVAEAARERGVQSHVAFFGRNTAGEVRAQHRAADLIVGNNVLAHVPDINDFVAGLCILLAADGAVTMEFPHLLRLIEGNQFDTIYHEHFSYLSLLTTRRIFEQHGLEIFDVEELPSHGGSLRVWAQRSGGARRRAGSVEDLIRREQAAGLESLATYAGFPERVERTKRRLLSFLIRARDDGKTVAGYGAPGKGNTLLNYCGIRSDLLEYTVDRNPFKHGKFCPGTRIPIHPPAHLDATRPDFVLILPWNLEREITRQLAHVSQWGGRFVVPIPELREYEPAAK